MAGHPPPVDRGELTFLSVDTRTPYVVDYPGEDGGKTAHYPDVRRDSAGSPRPAKRGPGAKPPARRSGPSEMVGGAHPTELYPDCDSMLADINGDGAIDGFDIDPFVALLLGRG